MATRIHIDIFGDQVLDRRLERFESRPRDLSGAYEALKPTFFGFEREQFDTQGASGSGGWAALKPSTIKAKAARGSAPTILQDTEHLFKSLTSDSDSQWAGHYTTREMFFGTSNKYAKFHQLGTRRMPQRRPVELSETQRKEFIKVFQSWLVSDDKAAKAL